MKAKKGYSGLDSFPLTFSSSKPDLLSVAGNDARVRQIGELFDSGAETEARSLLRKALHEVTHNLDRILADEREVAAPPVLGVLLEREV